MTGPEVLDVGREAVFVLLKVSSPLMLVGLGVGLVIALFQALTQIQEMTLVFVPKILAIFIALIIKRLAVEQLCSLPGQALDGRAPCSGNSLIRRDINALDTNRIVDGLQRHYHLYR